MKNRCTPCICDLKIYTNSKRVSIDFVIKEACKFFDISEKTLLSKWKNRELVTARYMIMKYTKSKRYSLKSIGIELGGRDHTTVMYGLKTMEDLIETDSRIKDEYRLFSDLVNRQWEQC